MEKNQVLNQSVRSGPNVQAAIRGALLTVSTLFGGLLIGLLLGDLVFHVLPGHSLTNPSPVHMAIAATPALLGFLAGGAAWGLSISRFANRDKERRMALAGMLGFAPITISLAIGLNIVETLASKTFLAPIPIHRLFTLLFVPAAFLIAGISTWAIGKGLNDNTLANWLFWRVGLASALGFLIVNLLMEASGWVVGAPGAAARLTMVTVMFFSNLSAALIGGAVLGWRMGNLSDSRAI
jgi:hypothetical protein